MNPKSSPAGMHGMIFNIDRFRVHDGEGIRTALFMKGCNLACPWCSNPESQSSVLQIAIHRNLCKLCGVCASVCPTQAISMSVDQTEMIVNRSVCRHCKICKAKCPNGAIELYGSEMSVTEVVNELKKDMMFFNRSNGGITISGGEPTLQADFVRQVMRECKQEYMYTAIETCGLASWENLWKCCEFCDEILFDIKTLVTQHFNKLLTDRNNSRSTALELVKNNVRELRKRGKRVIFRCVIVPGFNDTADHMELVIRFAMETGVQRIDILPFHQFGRHKYASLDMAYCYQDERSLSDSDVEQFARQIEKHGLECIIGG